MKTAPFLIFLILISFLPLPNIIVMADNWLTDWDYRIYIVLDNPTETLQNFPIMLNISESCGKNNYNCSFLFETIGDDYNKTAYVLEYTELRLYFEIEYWNSTEKKAIVWLNVYTISSAYQCGVYIYFDDNQNGSEYNNSFMVWDSNFIGVWHMRDNTTSTVLDSTNNTAHIEKYAGKESLEINGLIYTGQYYDGVDYYFSIGDGVKTNFYEKTEITISSSVYIIENGSDVNKFCFKSECYNLQQFTTDNKIRFELFLNSSYRACISYIESAPLNMWLQIVGDYNGLQMKIYVNGEHVSTNNYNNGVFSDRDTIPVFGYANFNGTQDETRISDIARSENWIQYDYNSQIDNIITFVNIESLTISDSIYIGLLALVIALFCLCLIIGKKERKINV